jgi:spore coat polysaccharide biosynthesis protein SpsF (cytidylyltransferase family)
MKKTLNVAIAIQARKSSSRFPEKSVKVLFGNTTVIDSLVDNCVFCTNHVAKKNQYYNVNCDVVILVPDDEKEFWLNFMRSKPVTIISGDLENVKSRYMKLKNSYDYVVRLTSDCPNVPAITINKLIFTAIHYELDYLANSWEKYRTSIDGHDCEIMSRRAMEWLEFNANEKSEKEHVTLAIRNKLPKELSIGALIGKEDFSYLKHCIDTEEEYKDACQRFESAISKRKQAIQSNIHVYEY